MLQIYNSITRNKEEFKPIKPGKVGMYVCGITVYDYCHIGHARTSVAFDVIAQYLRYSGYDVTYVHNITDIDDKIINRANEKGESITDLTERFIEAMHEDELKLGNHLADHQPRATQYIDKIIAMIQTLIDKGYAYVSDNGDVNYNIAEFKDYGKLSNKTLDDLLIGARVAVGESKRSPLDFVLWKKAKPGEPKWNSPWGEGRPGWHIECSAMSTDCLGATFDIHGGGGDLKFPHHENEIAQSEGATGKKFVNYWIHVGFVQVNQEKMSKSLGNFFTIREVLEKYKAEVVRYFLLASHYRSPIDYSQESLNLAQAALDRFYTTLRGLPITQQETGLEYEQRFKEAMDDDFNTPIALAVLFDLSHEINRTRDSDLQKAAQLAALLKRLARTFGLLKEDPEAYFHSTTASASVDKEQIEQLIIARNQARTDKDWQQADKIRQQLDDLGVVLEDGAGGTIWRLK